MSKTFSLNLFKPKAGPASAFLPGKLATVKSSILGQPERGKTYAGGVFAEELLENGCQTIILDSVGVWYGLRLAANGKGRGYDIHIFGGEHGDLPLVPTAGAVLAETLVRTRKSAIIDTTGFATEAEQRRFMADFAETFYRLKMRNKSRVTLILEEADDWIPQMPETTELRMLGAFQRIARKGRNFGIGLLAIAQRPQGVHKKVLNLSDVLFVFGISGKHERKAIRDWTEHNEVEEDVRDKALGMLPGLKMGQCLVWAPRFGIFGVYAIRKKRTFDASATPDGDEVSASALKVLDTAELAKAMAATVEEAKASDPKSLRARIAELEGEMAKRGRVTGKTVTKTIEVPVLGKREVKLLERVEKNVRALTDAVVSIQPVAAGVARDVETLRSHVRGVLDSVVSAQGSVTYVNDFRDALVERKRLDPDAPDAVAVDVPEAPAELRQRIVARLSFFHPVTLSREQLAFVCDISRTTKSFISAMAELTAEGTITQSGGRSGVLHGSGTWGTYGSPGERIDAIVALARKMARLEREALQAVLAAPGQSMRREDLAAALSISRTTKSFISAVSALASCRFLHTGGGRITLGRIIAEGMN